MLPNFIALFIELLKKTLSKNMILTFMYLKKYGSLKARPLIRNSIKNGWWLITTEISEEEVRDFGEVSVVTYSPKKVGDHSFHGYFGFFQCSFALKR